jgi:SAM-dependent methyltransferase
VLKRIARRLPRLKARLGGLLRARRSLTRCRPRHFRPLLGLFAPPPPLLLDRPAPDVEAINRNSEAYFEKAENRAYWLNRPYSDPASAARILSRFSLLLSALGPRPGDRVLDFGCGTGWTSAMLARLGASVVGMDIAPSALQIAREVADRELGADRGRAQFAVYGGARIDFPDQEFDFVVVNDAFHHFPNPRQLLQEFQRVLAPHGQFGFSEPGIGHAATAHSQAERALGVLEEDVDLEQLYRSGRAAGFADLEVLVPPLEPEALALSMDRARAFLRGRPGIVPARLLRLAILTGPMGVFRKGPYRVTSLHPRSHRAQIEPEVKALAVAPGASFTVAARVTNRTETVGLREGRRGIGYVRLGAHLHAATGEQRELDYGRGALAGDLEGGSEERVVLSLIAPANVGRYLVRLDMVNEGVCWFAQEGSPTADVSLDVRVT